MSGVTSNSAERRDLIGAGIRDRKKESISAIPASIAALLVSLAGRVLLREMGGARPGPSGDYGRGGRRTHTQGESEGEEEKVGRLRPLLVRVHMLLSFDEDVMLAAKPAPSPPPPAPPPQKYEVSRGDPAFPRAILEEEAATRRDHRADGRDDGEARGCGGETRVDACRERTKRGGKGGGERPPPADPGRQPPPRPRHSPAPASPARPRPRR